jgi:ADP-ribose pyrophosphatase YjhB (NUDIX family)
MVNDMPQKPAGDEVVFNTKWFQIVARSVPGSAQPYYLVNSTDFVVVVAVDARGKLLLVRQFRPAINATSLELPSGHVEEGETPEEAARKELLEETGHVGGRFELLTTLSPAIGRFTNRMWCYFVADARPSGEPGHEPEAGIELVLWGGTLPSLLSEKGFESSLSCSALFAAVLRGKLKLRTD